MKKAKDYFNYAVCNSLYTCIDGADDRKEAVYLALNAMKDAIDHGAKVTRSDYHVYRMNPETGEVNYSRDYLEDEIPCYWC